jgi:dipeptidyl aminopeptidase/acylaminoacyl peptidase
MCKKTIVFAVLSALMCLFPAAQGQGREATQPAGTNGAKGAKSIEVSDAIEMTRLGDHGYFWGASSKGRVALFSPDGSAFLIVLRKGNIVSDTNEFSLLLYKTADVFRHPKPDVLLTMATSSNRDAITQVRWLSDSERIAFLGENPGEPSQVYVFNIRTRRLERLTNSNTAITGYDMTADGTRILFEADVPPQENRHHREVLIEGQHLVDLIPGHDSLSLRSQEVFLQTQGRNPVLIQIPSEDYFLWPGSPLSIAPGGDYGLISAMVRNIPELWFGYREFQDQLLHMPKRSVSHLRVNFLYGVQAGTILPLVDAPSSLGARWDDSGQAVFVRTHLPLDVADPSERQARELEPFTVRVDVPSRVFHKMNEKDWPKRTRVVAPLEVTLEEDPNNPPRIFASDSATKQKIELLDLNPQFDSLQFGRVETVEWTIRDGLKAQGGLYLPPDYVPGKRYPLVIQTHGFNADRFSMDGNQEWSSGYAARPLASKGIVVLQAFKFADPQDEDHYNERNQFGSNALQAGLMVNVAGFEGAVDALDRRGIIDRSKVGIVGFSRTVCAVSYLLTHSAYRFAAASMVDGIDCGYFQEISNPDGAWDYRQIMGDALPFGKGLEAWMKESPSFSLGNVTTPVKLLALAPWEVLEQWEWYAGLVLQRKPVDYTFLQDEFDGDNHLLMKPWERVAAEQGLVDWFRFWLQGYEDTDESKALQYKRWRQLRSQLSSIAPKQEAR